PALPSRPRRRAAGIGGRSSGSWSCPRLRHGASNRVLREPGGGSARRPARASSVLAHIMAGMRIGSRGLGRGLLAASHRLALGLHLFTARHLAVGVLFAAAAGHVVAFVPAVL